MLQRGQRRMCTSASTARVSQWLSKFERNLADGRAHESFSPAQCYWRDHVAFSWSLNTFEGRDQIQRALDATAAAAAPTQWSLDGSPSHAPDGVTECFLDFKTTAGRAKGHVRLDAEGKALTLATSLRELDGRPFAIGRRRPLGHPCEHVHEIATPVAGRRYWHERRRAASMPRALGGEAEEPYVLIIGGGQAGLSLGARLKLLGVPYLISEAHSRVGDSWRSRYPGLLLHDPVWYDHLPYIPFPASWPVFTPRDKVADWLEMYANAMDLDVSLNTSVTRAVPPCESGDADGRWVVSLRRRGGDGGGGGSGDGDGDGDGGGDGGDGDSGAGEAAVVRPSHVVFATGMSGYPRVPQPPGTFDGTCMHSSTYSGAAAERYAGRRAVVVGSNTSAHDICQDLWEQGAASVTMLQRSAGLIVSEESILSIGMRALYSEEALESGIPHELADLITTTLPYRVQEERWREGTRRMREQDARMHEALTEAGYRLDFGVDGTGVYGKSFRQGGGFYIDVGCASLIASGRVGLRSGSDACIARLDADAVILDSGERLPADLLIYATGYSSMHYFVRDLVSERVAKAVGRVWGYGSGAAKDPGPFLGELRNMWKPTRVDGMWFMGGNLAQARHYSRLVALQLAARYDGLPTPVYAPEAAAAG